MMPLLILPGVRQLVHQPAMSRSTGIGRIVGGQRDREVAGVASGWHCARRAARAVWPDAPTTSGSEAFRGCGRVHVQAGAEHLLHFGEFFGAGRERA